MPFDKLATANEALALVGANRVATLSDTTPEGKWLQDLYDGAIDEVATAARWTWNTAKRRLDRNPTAPINEWSYAHDLPEDRIAGPWAYYTTGTAYAVALPAALYDVQGAQVLSDRADLWCDYQRALDIGAWPTFMRAPLVYALAARLASPITQTQEVVKRLASMAAVKLAEARGVDARSAGAMRIGRNPLGVARRTGPFPIRPDILGGY